LLLLLLLLLLMMMILLLPLLLRMILLIRVSPVTKADGKKLWSIGPYKIFVHSIAFLH